MYYINFILTLIIFHIIFVYTSDLEQPKKYYYYNNITSYKYHDNYIHKTWPTTQEKVLQIKDINFPGFYCKKNLCISEGDEPFVEFADKNGNIKMYIPSTCNYNIKNTNCVTTLCSSNECFSNQCTSDSECLSNKCFISNTKENLLNGCCIFNDEFPITHCANIHTRYGASYMHCGKTLYDSCQDDDECGSLNCVNNYCEKQKSVQVLGIGDYVTMYIIILIIILIIIIILCCFCHIKLHKHKPALLLL